MEKDKNVVAGLQEDEAQWELINPEGIRLPEGRKLVHRPPTLEGKTVTLYWNTKPNGDIFLDRVAELLVQKVKGVKINKHYLPCHGGHVWFPITADASRNEAQEVARSKPDVVIASTGD